MLSEANAQGVSMYGAQGWAAITPGGRNGKIIKVTNLNASGAGSFTEALKTYGTRIIVFEVGGVINLLGSTVSISNPNVTIAGQTAPSPGITVVNGTIGIGTHDVVMEHIRVRPGAAGHQTGWEPDGPSAISAHHVLIDHCSMSWAVDENCSASGPRFEGSNPDEWRSHTSHDITISNNLIAEGLSNATHTKGQHSMGSLIHDNVTNVSILRNLYSGNNARNPLFKAGAMGVVVNNYIYNPGSSAVRYALVVSEWEGHDWVTGQMSIVGNVMQLGPSSKEIPFMVATNSPCELYLSDNIAKNSQGTDMQLYKGDAPNIVQSKPIWNDNIDVLAAGEVKDFVLAHVGARPWDRDQVDERLISEVVSGTGRIIDFETEVGGYPNYAQTTTSFFSEEWNLDYMIRLTPEIELSIALDGDSAFVDSVFEVSANVVNPSFETNYLELMVNGVSYGVKKQAPYNWAFSADSSGQYDFVIIAEKTDLNLGASKTISLQVIDLATGKNAHRKVDPKKVVPLLNYPNPFYSSTTIDYYLPEPNAVSIRIFNSMGQEMETLYTGNKTQGRHQITWSPKNLVKGPYLIVLISEASVYCYKTIYGM